MCTYSYVSIYLRTSESHKLVIILQCTGTRLTVVMAFLHLTEHTARLTYK